MREYRRFSGIVLFFVVSTASNTFVAFSISGFLSHSDSEKEIDAFHIYYIHLRTLYVIFKKFQIFGDQ